MSSLRLRGPFEFPSGFRNLACFSQRSWRLEGALAVGGSAVPRAIMVLRRGARPGSAVPAWFVRYAPQNTASVSSAASRVVERYTFRSTA